MVILVGLIFRFDLWLLLLHDYRTRFSICSTMNVMVSIEFLMYLTIAIYNERKFGYDLMCQKLVLEKNVHNIGI